MQNNTSGNYPKYYYQKIDTTSGSSTSQNKSGVYCQCGTKMYKTISGQFRCPQCDNGYYNLPYNVITNTE